MLITSHFVILLQAIILINMCNGRPCHKVYRTSPTLYPGFSASQTYFGTPNYAYQPYMQPQSFSPAYPAYHAYQTYSAPAGPPGHAVMQTNPYVILQQPTQVPQTNNGPYGVSLFKETVLSTSTLQVQAPRSTLSRNTPQSQIILPPLAEVLSPQKRETPETIKINPDKSPALDEPKELKFPPELYAPEDEFLHPSLHRFPHDLFPYAETQPDDNRLDKDKPRRQSHNDEFTNCTFGHSCSDCDKEKNSNNLQGNLQTHHDHDLRSFEDLDPNNHNQEEHDSGVRTQIKSGFTLDDFNSEMKSGFKNQKFVNPISSTDFSNVNRYYIPTVNYNTHTQSYENDLNQSNSKRDTHSTSLSSLSTQDVIHSNLTDSTNHPHEDVSYETEPSREVETGGCKCLQQLKKCVHDAKNIAEYLVKKACDVIGNVSKDEV